MPGIIPPGPAIGQLQRGMPASETGNDAARASAVPADGLRGYADLRQSVARHLNRHLYNAARLDKETMRILGRGRKVGR